MKLTPPAWLQSETYTALFDAVRAHGGELRLVGGVVRDMVRGTLGESLPSDIDAAVNLPPETMMMLASTLGIKAIPTGIAHGTVTLLLPPGKLEVTTLRRDVATDGRHAKVAYTDTFEEDASRRDFTMNALYMAQDGTVYDYTGGVAAAKAGELHFIGDAERRIEEDALRMLRYFRFLATHGNGAVDAVALAACAEKKALLAKLSGERIAQEMGKLLAAKNPQAALVHMDECGLLADVLMGPANLEAHGRLLGLELRYEAAVHPWLRLSVLLSKHSRDMLDALVLRLRFSNEIKQLLLSLAGSAPVTATTTAEERKHMIREYGAAYFRLLLLRSAALAEVPWDLRDAFEDARSWQPPQFPVSGVDLIAYGVPQGKKVGEQLRKLEEIWEQSEYALDKPSLLKKIKDSPSR